MIGGNSLLNALLVILKVIVGLLAILLAFVVFLLIKSGGDGSILFPGLGLVVAIWGVVVLLAIIIGALLLLIALLSKFTKSLS